MQTYDAIVIGSGPNGLSASIALARRQKSVLLIEAANVIGGGTRSAELTLPGFVHDVCSSIHPMAIASPFWKVLPLAEYGLEWQYPEVEFAHPLDDGTAAAAVRSVEATANTLGADQNAYRELMQPFVEAASGMFDDLLGPPKLPRHLLTVLRFGWQAKRSAQGLADAWFRTRQARALLAGLAAHAVLPLEQSPAAAITLMLGIAAHSVGWPFPHGGAQKIANALAAYFCSLGGTIETNRRIATLDELPQARVVLLDVTPRQLLKLAGHLLPDWYCRMLKRYRYGPGIFKVDWALAGPIPWTAAVCRRAGTVHVGGTLEEIAQVERAPWRAECAARPFVLVTQPGAFDTSRAPEGKTTAWGYCHVPHASTTDMTDRIEAQIERFAPGFRDLILARHTMNCIEVERHNANCIGGDIVGGVANWRQLFARPVPRLNPYATPNPSIFICSASTPPGAGVHGMCGYFAAKAALRRFK